MIIPGFLVSIATFPGVIVHELAHAFFCKTTGTQVFKVCYFRLGNPAGYVIHAQPTNVWKHILIGVGPLFFNTLIGLLCGFITFFEHVDTDKLTVVTGVFLWLAISITMHSFPSTGDAKSIWNSVWAQGTPMAAKLVYRLDINTLRVEALDAAGQSPSWTSRGTWIRRA